MDIGGAGSVVVSAGPEGCSSSSQLVSNAPRLVETLRRFTQLCRRFLNLFTAVMNSRKAEGAVISTSRDQRPAWLCEVAQSTTSSYSTFPKSVTTSMSFPASLPLES